MMLTDIMDFEIGIGVEFNLIQDQTKVKFL